MPSAPRGQGSPAAPRACWSERARQLRYSKPKDGSWAKRVLLPRGCVDHERGRMLRPGPAGAEEAACGETNAHAAREACRRQGLGAQAGPGRLRDQRGRSGPDRGNLAMAPSGEASIVAASTGAPQLCRRRTAAQHGSAEMRAVQKPLLQEAWPGPSSARSGRARGVRRASRTPKRESPGSETRSLGLRRRSCRMRIPSAASAPMSSSRRSGNPRREGQSASASGMGAGGRARRRVRSIQAETFMTTRLVDRMRGSVSETASGFPREGLAVFPSPSCASLVREPLPGSGSRKRSVHVCGSWRNHRAAGPRLARRKRRAGSGFPRAPGCCGGGPQGARYGPGVSRLGACSS